MYVQCRKLKINAINQNNQNNAPAVTARTHMILRRHTKRPPVETRTRVKGSAWIIVYQITNQKRIKRINYVGNTFFILYERCHLGVQE